MPATRFKCPDGVEITVGECLQKCRLGRRCLTLPTLIKIASSERPYSGVPSTTRLLNGAMLEYLKVTTEYAINPKDRAYALLGQDHHAQLAELANPAYAEHRQGKEITGTPDLIEPDELVPDHFILTDYKTFGSYRVAKILGIVKEKVKSTTEKYVKSGSWGRVGDFKTITTFRIDASKIEMEDEMLQLNHYRVLLEEAKFPISYMQLQITVRDGGIQMARERGVTENIYLVPVPFMETDYIKDYFKQRASTLAGFIDGSIPTVVCNSQENWDEKRCENYCEVAENCILGRQVLHLGPK